MVEYYPDTIVRVLSNVPLDNTYTDTIKFNSLSEQQNYFISKTSKLYTDLSYQRPNYKPMGNAPNPRTPSTLRVPELADDLYNCNYLMFQNHTFGEKWFYAFIKQVNYVSPVCCEIEYEIDDFQTWQFNFSFQPCLVEREHANNDTPFSNTCPEPVSVDYYDMQYTYPYYYPDKYIVLCATPSEKLPTEFIDGDLYGGIYSGLCFYSQPVSSVQNVSLMIRRMDTLGIGESITSIFMTSLLPKKEIAVRGRQETTLIPKETTNFNGYTIKNNKLMCFPYRKIELASTNGQTTTLMPQLLNGDNLQVTFYDCASPSPSIVCVPNYQGSTTDFTNSVEYRENVECQWNNEVYANWLGQNLGQETVNILTQGGKMIIGGLMAGSMANPAVGFAMGASGALGLAKDFARQADMKRLPDTPNGRITGNANFSIGRIGFEIRDYRLNANQAKIIDDFFSMYGYATNLVKIPNLTGRSSWNYVKTNNAIITGTMPVESMAKIKSMFNNGIRLWHGDFVGDYGRSNDIV